MGEKTKNKVRIFFITSTTLAALFFIFFNATQAFADGVVINEVMYNPAGTDNSSEKSSYEWVELKNTSSEPQDIHSWEVRMNTYFPLSALTAPIPSGGFVVIFAGAGTNDNIDFSQRNVAYLYRNKSGSQLGDSSGDVSLYKSSARNKNTIADFLAYGKIPSPGNTNYKHATDAGVWKAESFIENAPEGKSIELKELSSYSDSSEDWQESYVSGGTPGKENSKQKLEPGPPDTDTSDSENKDEESEHKIYPHEIRISELLPDPKGNDSALEFIELENYSTSEIDLTEWSIQDAQMNTFKLTYDDYCVNRIDLCKVPAGGFFVMYSQDYSYKNNLALNNASDSVQFLDPSGKVASTVSYAEKKVKENYAYAFDGNDWQWTSLPTPSEKNQFDIISQGEVSPKKIASSYSREIRLNEILPNASEEYIELYNNDTLAIDLSGWILRDASKKGKYVLPENTFIPSKSFMVILKKEFKFALNNSGEESVFLYNPNEELVSSLSYTGSKKDISYSFDGSSWRWSRFLTPGIENKFSEPLEIKIKKPEYVYRDIPAFFEVDIASPSQKEAKITWDFGDGRKSYQFSTRHTYKNTGVYEASVKVSAQEDFSETFLVTVENFPEIKVKISALAPNPKGKDTDFEWIEIENNSKHKVNLENWSVATGWDKLINHPVRKEFIIKAGESKKLTRKFAHFTLQNKKSKIELRYPDGEVAHAVKYKSAKPVADDMIYQKEKKKKWKWIAATDNAKDKKNKSDPAKNDTALASATAPIENISPVPATRTTPATHEDTSTELTTESLNNAALRESFGYSESLEWKEKKNKITALLDGRSELQSIFTRKRTEIINKLLSIKTVHARDEIYLFTDSMPEEHYAVRFVRNLRKDMNYWLGKIVIKLF